MLFRSQHLKQSLAITGKLHNIQRSLDDISSGSIILLDMMEADKKLIHYWQDTLSRKNNNIKILLLNTPEDYPYRDIENWVPEPRKTPFFSISRACPADSRKRLCLRQPRCPCCSVPVRFRGQCSVMVVWEDGEICREIPL